MTRLERWARWYLPRPDAEDVLCDYHDIAGDPPRPDEELLRDLGRPRAVVKPLAQPRQYRAWLAAFTVMTACILLPALGPWPSMGLYAPQIFGDFPTYSLFFEPLWTFFFDSRPPLYWLAFIPGLILPLVWFRPQKGAPKLPLPRAIPVAMAALLVPMAAAWWFFLQLDGFPDSFLWRFAPLPGSLIAELLIWTGFAAALAGVAALVKARTRDRRWRTVYLLALTSAMVFLSVLDVFCAMDPDFPIRNRVTVCLVLTVMGLAGTGAGLC